MRPNLYDRTNRLKDDILRLKNAVCAYEMTDAARYPENFEDLGMDIAMRAEAIACTARNLVGTYPASSRKRMLHTVTDAQGIEVMETEMGYEIIIPQLLPKRNGRQNVVFLLEPLSFALECFCQEKEIRRMEQAFICYTYEYVKGIPVRSIRDYDNLEAKEVLDVINAFFLLDDSGAFCELHYRTKVGKKNCTHIEIRRKTGQMWYPKMVLESV